MTFQEKLIAFQNIIEVELKKYISTEECPEKKLNQSKNYSLISTGKRIRPILILATYKLFKDDISECLPYCVAMEMIHNFSLIHDDLPGIDNDDFRHGKLTNHKQFGEATAILAGDSLLNNAYLIISELLCSNAQNIENRLLALKELATSTDRMIIGEYVDVEFENKQISEINLEYMHKNKTGALIKSSVRIGAILAGASKQELAILTNYAEKIGLAFQIKDDILSKIGDEKTLGKPVGNDEKLKKSTYITKYGLEKSQELLKQIVDEAISEIAKLDVNSEFLKELTMYIEKRNK